MSNLGRSVRLFLVDGKSTGLITAEIMNWTGHVLTGPRAELPKFLTRQEVSRTGVYLLYGQDTVNADTVMLYIGESDNVGARLKQHNQEGKKDYWERTCIITSKDQNITKAHALLLKCFLDPPDDRAGLRFGIPKALHRPLRRALVHHRRHRATDVDDTAARRHGNTGGNGERAYPLPLNLRGRFLGEGRLRTYHQRYHSRAT